MMAEGTDWKAVHDAAYAAMDRGALTEATGLFHQLADAFPERHYLQYMLGLAYKYQRNWTASLRHNLLALQADGDQDLQGEHWNAAIAATALGEWRLAREHWKACGLPVEPGDTPIEENWGVVSIRLNAWGDGETVFARRLGPAVARLTNVPFAESGYRYGDEVLFDGAQTGERKFGEQTVPVFNALQPLKRSPFLTFTVEVHCEDQSDAKALEQSIGNRVSLIEDWTASVQWICALCSHGVPHEHEQSEREANPWTPVRRFGIGAATLEDVRALLDWWLEGAGAKRGLIARMFDRSQPRREVLELDSSIHEVPAPEEEFVWWQTPRA